jgi:hypothetical protein
MFRLKLFGEVHLVFYVGVFLVIQVLMTVANNSGHGLARELQVVGEIGETCAMFRGASYAA